ALFGSYDDSPAAAGVVSPFPNPLPHHVHQTSAGAAAAFLAGLGAGGQDAVVAGRGVDPAPRRVRDRGLRKRLSAGGARIILDPSVQGTHLKRWGLAEMIRTDFARRGIPWVGLMLRHGSSSRELNLGWRHRASAVASIVATLAVLGRRPRLVVA